jgi:hypoxanthine phosphoribosyltransferase
MIDMYDDIEEIIFTEEQIQQKVRELARQVSTDYHGKDLCVVTILRGAAIFLADFTRYLSDINFTIDFLVVSRGCAGSSGEVKIIKDLDHPVYKKHVLIIEEMIDMGESLNYVMELLKLRDPASVKICTLFEKPYHRSAEIESDYVGFMLPDNFVVGYGLDYHQKYRNLPYVGVLKKNLSPY